MGGSGGGGGAGGNEILWLAVRGLRNFSGNR